MRTILLIASVKERYYYDAFLKAAESRGLKVFVFDQNSLIEGASFSLAMNEFGHLTGFIDVLKMSDECDTVVRLDIRDIQVAWYVREGSSQQNHDQSLETRFKRNETRQAILSLMSVLDCVWINRAETIDSINSNKFFQQRIAAQCGLAVPSTVMTNYPPAVYGESRKKDGLLFKSIGYITLSREKNYYLYSECFSHQELLEHEVAIANCPVYAQHYVEKRYEYRVMAIGNRVLSCRIDSQASEKTKIDWRHYDFDNVGHVQVSLPNEVEEKILYFMRTIGLRYGAIDLIESPEGDFVFLEVNPSGQWGWIADLAGLSIAEAVADMLETAT